MRDTSRGSLEASERLRLFCALRLPHDVLDAVERWQREHLHDCRIVPREHLHVTLAFLGATPAERAPDVATALGAAAARSGAIEFLLPPGRLRVTRSVAMLVLRDLAGTALALAEDLFGRLEQLGLYEREKRPWLPHITVLRFRDRPALDPPLPEVGPFGPSDAAVYLSRLHPGGARYEVLDSFALGG